VIDLKEVFFQSIEHPDGLGCFHSNYKRKKMFYDNYVQKSNIKRFNESSYDIMDLIQRKRTLRENSTKASQTQPLSNSNQHRPQQQTSTSSIIKPAKRTCDQSIKPSTSQQSINKVNLTSKNESEIEKRQDFLHDILKWNTSWFKNGNEQLSLCAEPAQQLKLCYSSVEEYIKFYKPLILHEIFAQIAERVDALKKSTPSKTTLFIELYEIEDNFLVLTCVLPVTNDDYSKNNYPIEGDLMLVEISIMKNQKEAENTLIFGYVSEHVVDEINEKTKQSKISYPSTCKKLLRYIIKLKLMNVKINTSKNIRCSSIFYLKPKLKQCEAVVRLDKSALHQAIINPESQLLPIKINHQLKNDPKYNTSQLNVIHNTNQLVNGSLPGVMLIHGPPGTGKTHTLIGIVKKLFIDWKESGSCPKILICAPSNGAIDEIGKRLHKERDFLKTSNVNRPLRIVRIGQEESMNEDVRKNLFIGTLIENNIRLQNENKNGFRKSELDEKESELNKLLIRSNTLEKSKDLEELNRVKSNIIVVRKQISYLEKEEGKKEKKTILNNEVLRKKYRIDLLVKADVILTTLSSCCNSSLLQVFNESRIFNCCIIDEASQCSEPEILMPLSFNSINKLILIGDPMQLPATTISTVASRFGFGTSLFERFYCYVQTRPSFNQYYIMLNIQYRMHSEICSFPSRLFYNNRLGTDSKTDRRNFPLIPYKVFDVKGTKECKKNARNIHNSRESDFVLKLTSRCSDIIESCKRFNNCLVRIGIITPYQGQRKLLEEGINRYEKGVKVRIEVNTIDGFQGREMDIIIISAVRSFGDQGAGGIGFLNSPQRLNVAITRAKCSLFICLNGDFLKENSLWNELIEDAKRRNVHFSCFAQVEDDFIDNQIVNHSPRLF